MHRETMTECRQALLASKGEGGDAPTLAWWVAYLLVLGVEDVTEALQRANHPTASPPEDVIRVVEDFVKLAMGAGWVYVFRNRHTGLVKIGYSADPAKRLYALQSASGVPLEFVGAFPGTLDDEKAAHQQFDSLRRLGEWFDDHPSITWWMESHGAETWEIASRFGIVGRLDEGRPGWFVHVPEFREMIEGVV